MRKFREGEHVLRKQLEMQQKREKMLHQIKNYRLLDDDFMTKCFENNIEATELVLRIIGKLKSFFDGSHIIYINATYQDDSELGKLMYDFNCSNPDDMNYEVLAQTARFYKEDKEGFSTMCKAVEDLIKDKKRT